MSSRGKIKVVIVESLPVYLHGLLSELIKYNEIEVVGETIDGNKFYQTLKKINPNVFIFDDKLLQSDFANFIKTVRQISPDTKLVILLSYIEPATIRWSIKQGVSGCLTKDSKVPEIVKAIMHVHSGKTYFNSKVKNYLDNNYTVSDCNKINVVELTPREIEILRFIAEELSNKEIGAKLGISVRTVETHREHIENKLNIYGTAALTKYAIKRGLIQI